MRFIVDKSEPERPLSAMETSRLKANRLSLRKEIDPTYLLDWLAKYDVINEAHREKIRSIACCRDQNRELLDILMRRSSRDYNNFIKCLHLTNQSHVAKRLQGDAGGKFDSDDRLTELFIFFKHNIIKSIDFFT